jgi:hypothetical protein
MNIQPALDQLRRLNEPVPKPRRLPTEAEVSAAESRLGMSFHPDYRHYLLHGSDIVFATLEPAVVTPNAGYLDLVQMVTEARELGVPAEWLPFCETNSDYHCLKPDGSVVFWSHNGATDETWPDLATWIVEVWIGEHEDDE